MLAAAIVVIVELAVQIAGIQSGQARDEPAVSLASQSMACRASVRRSAIAAAEGNHFAACAECGIAALRPASSEACGQEERSCGEKSTHPQRNHRQNRLFPKAMDDHRTGALFALMAMLPLLSACEDVPVAPHDAQPEAIKRGRLAAGQLGCGACHKIPGIWPEGATGPDLTNLAERGVIAGSLPNRPAELTAYLLDPPATVPGTAMPKVPMTRQQAEDIAAFLHQPDAH